MDSSQQRMLIYQLVQTLLNLLKTVYGRFPTTDAALMLIQSQLLKTVHGFSRHGCQSIAYSDPQFRDVPKHGCLSNTRPLTSDIQFNNSQMASISPSSSRHFQMASLSPFPDGIYKPILLPAVTKWHL